MSLAFRIYKTIIRPSFHLIEFNKQIVLFSCKFEKKIALFRFIAFPCLPRLPLRQRKFVKSRGKYKSRCNKCLDLVKRPGEVKEVEFRVRFWFRWFRSFPIQVPVVPVVPVVSFRLFRWFRSGCFGF
jgi:hypothetical protein